MSFKRYVLAVSTLILVAYGVSVTLVGPCVTSMEESFAVSHAAMGWLFAAGSLGYLFGVRLGGWLSAHLGIRRSMSVGVAGLGLGMLAVAASPRFGLAIAGHCLCGMAGGVVEPALVAAVQLLYAEKRRRALNLSQAGFGIGAIGGPWLARMIFSAGHAWRVAFVISGLAILALLILIPRRSIRAAAESALLDPGAANGAAPEHDRQSLRNPALWLSAGLLLFYVGGELGLTSWSSPYFEKVRGATKETASLAPLMLWLGVTIGRLAMGAWQLPFSSRALLTTCMLGSLIASLASVLSPWLPLSWAMLVLAGILFGPVWPTAVDHAASRLGTTSPTVMAWVIFGGAIGALSQAGLGFVAQRASLTVAMGLNISLLLGGLLCLLGDRWLERRELAR